MTISAFDFLIVQRIFRNLSLSGCSQSHRNLRTLFNCGRFCIELRTAATTRATMETSATAPMRPLESPQKALNISIARRSVSMSVSKCDTLFLHSHNRNTQLPSVATMIDVRFPFRRVDDPKTFRRQREPPIPSKADNCGGFGIFRFRSPYVTFFSKGIRLCWSI
jgi:hypothetical protein